MSTDQNTSSTGTAAHNTTEGGAVRAAQLTELLANAPANTDHDALRVFASVLAGLGCAVLFIYPNSKLPCDMRTPQKRKADDIAAREAAREAGHRNWRKAKSDAGVYLATTDAAVLDGYLTAYLKTFGPDHPDGVPVNIAVDVGASGLVVVDADTPEQVASFAAGSGAESTPTVSTPGQIDPATGEWKHSDGGHWWFDVPEGAELPEGLKAVGLGEPGYTVKYGTGTYVLIPPSTRPEGAYKTTGGVESLPGWLREAITERARERAKLRARVVDLDDGDPIRAWGAGTTWAEIMAAYAPDWKQTGKVDGCGCDVWTAPGLHASPKSATAHEAGCPEYPDSPDPTLRIWTDGEIAPFDRYRDGRAQFNLTRFQAVAAGCYGGDEGAAMQALDEASDTSDKWLSPDDCAWLDSIHVKAESGDGQASGASETGPPLGVWLPAEFWEARPSLRHVRDAALATRRTPDAVLAANMARVASWTPPRVTVDTGIKSPISLNFYAAPVSVSGKGKTSSINSGDLIDPQPSGWSLDPMANDPPVMKMGDEAFPRFGKIRSGEGIAEQFWDQPTTTLPNGTTKRGVRRRVRSNVFMHTDEGAGLVKHILDDKLTVGETLREAWVAETIGQSNADAAKYRLVEPGTYRLGVVTGFALSTFAELMTDEQIRNGTPQRFYLAWSKPDPRQITREMLHNLVNPGPLRVAIPCVPMRVCAAIRDRVDDDQITEWMRLDDAGDQADIRSQQVVMVARIAGLLAILDGRTETDEDGLLVITEDDWHLAEIMFETSVTIASYAVESRRREQRTVKRKQRALDLAYSIEDDEARSTPEGRVEARIMAALIDGRMPTRGRKGLHRRFRGDERKLCDAVLSDLAERGTIRLVKDGGVEYVERVE